jgi:hypothetical protein
MIPATSSVLAGNSLNRIEGFNQSPRVLQNLPLEQAPDVVSRSSVKVSLSAESGFQGTDKVASPESPVYSKPENATFADSRTNESQPAEEPDKADNQQTRTSANDTANQTGSNNLTEQELQIIEKMKARDREVRAHEQAHKSVGGQYAGAISFSYQSGPDGRRYAVGGEVPIDVSPIPGNPEATIAKMAIVKAAATAPAQPSTQDIMVASEAGRIMLEAQNDLMLEKTRETDDSSPASGKPDQAEDSSEDLKDSRAPVNTDDSRLGMFQAISNAGQTIQSAVDVLV